MAVEVGELVVGAYLKEVLGCDFVDYNVRAPGGGRAGQPEFDVLGLHFGDRTAYLCEVATHLGGLNYGGKSYRHALDTVALKHGRQREYARTCLGTAGSCSGRRASRPALRSPWQASTGWNWSSTLATPPPWTRSVIVPGRAPRPPATTSSGRCRYWSTFGGNVTVFISPVRLPSWRRRR